MRSHTFFSSEIVLHGNPSLHSLSTGYKSAKSVWTNGCPLLQWNCLCIALMVGVLCWRGAQKTKGFLQLKHFPTRGRTSLQRALHWRWCAVSWASCVRCLVWAWGGLQMAFMTVLHFPVEVRQSHVPRGPSLHGKEASLTVDELMIFRWLHLTEARVSFPQSIHVISSHRHFLGSFLYSSCRLDPILFICRSWVNAAGTPMLQQAFI